MNKVIIRRAINLVFFNKKKKLITDLKINFVESELKIKRESTLIEIQFSRDRFLLEQ